MTGSSDNEFIIRRLLADAKDYSKTQLFDESNGLDSEFAVPRHEARIELLEYLKEQYLQGGKKDASL